MAEFIPKSALLAKLKEESETEWVGSSCEHRDIRTGIRMALVCVENFPAVDAEPVKHGKLVRSRDYEEWWDYYYICRECGTSIMHSLPDTYESVPPNYCPHCGTKLDGDENA